MNIQFEMTLLSLNHVAICLNEQNKQTNLDDGEDRNEA